MAKKTLDVQVVIDTINKIRTKCDTNDLDDYHDLLVECIETLASEDSDLK